MTNKKEIFKNLTCLAFCFVMIFVTSIFVSETYYNQIINNQVQEVSILKSVHFEDWAKMETPSSIIHKFQAYSYDQQGQPHLVNSSMKYQYTYQYSNISFSQGNTGNIQYLNKWKRTYIPENDQNSEDVQLNVLNVDAEKVYNYDYFSPNIRSFALMYNIMFDSLSKDFLNNFYGYYLFEYFFNNSKMVQTRIFQPLGISQTDGLSIYNNQLYGFKNPLLVTAWLQLSQDIISKSYYLSPFYAGIREDLKLSESQVLYIAGESSTLRNLFIALKGSLKYKLWSRDYGYQCQSDFCSKQVLTASQLAFGFLTKESIFAATNIDKLANELNNTFYSPIQYSEFCNNNPNMSCLDKQSSISFFVSNYLSNYTQVNFILNNLDKPELLEDRYQFAEGTGQSITKYVEHLYTNVFNIPLVTENQETVNNFETMRKSFTNYNHIQKVLDNARDLLYTQIHTRGFYNKFINKTESVNCQDYYTGDFQNYKTDCKFIALNFSRGVSSVRNYISASLGISNQQLTKYSTMNGSVLYEFLHNSEKSLFAQQFNKLQEDLKDHYDCKYQCTSMELMSGEWKNGSILSNLPQEYFSTKEESILNWDYNDELNGFEPQIYKYVKVQPTFNAGEVFNSFFGVYSLFNLMKIYARPNEATFEGVSNKNLLSYLQSLVLNVDFNGMYIKKSLNSFFNGYQSDIIKYKNKMNDTLGGASWLDPTISIIQLQNNPTKFNSINSGIYDNEKLRSLSLIENSKYSSSQYIIFQSQNEDLRKVFKSDKKVKGTNLLGFQTDIQEFDSIQGYFDAIYQSRPLVYKNTQTWKDLQNQQIQAFRFQFGNAEEQFSISIEEQANRTVKMMSDSYVIVQPQTGLTLEMYIKYTVYSQPFFLQLINGNKKLPLYQGQIFYVNDNTDKIVELNKDKKQLSFLFLLGVILSSISIVFFIIMLILYCKFSRDASRRKEQKRSLLTSSENNIGSSIMSS